MNIKKNFKRFFTLSRRSDAGFTLVELIVVIAILAILAGVAIPAYSGYVKKAERAGDEQLLAAVNTAFAAACIAEGADQYNLPSTPDINLVDGTDGKKVDSVTMFDESFKAFYAGNETSEFKVFEDLYYNASIGGFAENASVSFTFAGTTVTLSAEDVAILSGDNAFSALGSAALLGEVGNLENLIELGAGDEILDEIMYTPDFVNSLGSYLDVSREDGESDDEYMERVYGHLEENYDEDALYSAQVMYAASQAAGATSEQITALFTYNENQGVTGRIEGETDAQTMANAALAYGMYIAYADKNNIDTSDISNFSLTLGTKEFCDYVASSEGQADLTAYMSAMNMIGDNTSNPEVTTSILNNGITGNMDLQTLMQEVMGN